MNYEIVVEQTENGFSAYVPDLPGCVAAAETREETVALLREAIDFHIEFMRERSNLSFSVPFFITGSAHTESAAPVDVASSNQVNWNTATFCYVAA